MINMMDSNNLKTLFILFSIGLISACAGNTESRIATEVAQGIAQTQQISELQTAAAGGEQAAKTSDLEEQNATPEPSSTATATVIPTATESPTITFTPTADIPFIAVSQDTNCRSGPASAFTYLTTISPGENYEVVGLWDEGNEYVIIDLGSYNCWLWTRYADNRDFPGFDLPSHSTPATPTPVYAWNGDWELWLEPFNFPSVTFVQNGNSFSYTISAFGTTQTSTGTLNANYQIVTGTWENTIAITGTFQFMIKEGNTNQFVGNTITDGGLTSALCGARNGASKPSPCQWP